MKEGSPRFSTFTQRFEEADKGRKEGRESTIIHLRQEKKYNKDGIGWSEGTKTRSAFGHPYPSPVFTCVHFISILFKSSIFQKSHFVRYQIFISVEFVFLDFDFWDLTFPDFDILGFDILLHL